MDPNIEDKIIKPISPLVLRQWILKTSKPESNKDFIIIDVRDRDFKYAHITGSIHCPSRAFNGKLCESLIKVYPVDKYCYAFHCMRSENRGPTCSRFFLKYLLENGKDIKDLEIFVLEGGFKRWFELFEDVEELMTPL